MTEPLTPSDCDLRDFAFMKLDVMRVLDSDLFALSTGEEFKAAIALWCKAWLQVPAASLPDDDRILAHLSGAGARWRKLREMALRGWVKCSDGRLYHPVVAEKALEAWESRGKYAEKREQDRERLRKWREEKRVSGALRNADETQRKPLREGEGEGEFPLAKANGAAIQKNGSADEQSADADKRFWDAAKGYLGKTKSPMIGRWVRDYGQAATAQAITAAQISRAVDPVPFVEAALRRGKAQAEEVPIV